MEKSVLRLFLWLLPLTIAIVTVVILWGVWALAGLDAGMLVPLPLKKVVIIGLVGFMTGLALVGLWALSLRMPRRFNSFRMSTVLALLLALTVEAGVRHSTIVDLLWAGVVTRSQDKDDFFIREVGQFRRLALTNNRSKDQPRLMTVGSSQLIMGIDYALLQRLRTDMLVERRCIAGMSSARALMVSPWLEIRAGDVIVVYWSEFDMAGMSGLGEGWFRPIARPSGVSALIEELPRSELRHAWRGIVELRWAATMELWRSRDAWRTWLFNSLGTKVSTSQSPQVKHVEQSRPLPVFDQTSDDQTPWLPDQDEFFQMGIRSALRLLRNWREAGAEVIVLEGSLHPALRLNDNSKMQQIYTRMRLMAEAKALGITYVPISNQSYVPELDHWLDGTHLNKSGQFLFTRYVADLVPSARTK